MFSRASTDRTPTQNRRRDLPRLLTVCLWLSPLIIVAVLVLRVYASLLSTYYERINWSKDSFWVEAFYSVGALYDAVVISVNTFRSTIERHNIPVKSEIPTVRLNIEPGSMEKMLSKPNHMKKSKYYSAQLMYPDRAWHPIKYRLRGRNIWHWQPNKPSLRLKLKRSLPLDLQRHINLVNPEDRPMISNMYGEVLAGKMGVLTHNTKFVRLFVNDKYSGVFHWTTREDESLLIHKKRVSGPFFIGDTLGHRWKAEQFQVAGNEEVLKRFNPLEKMLSALYKPIGHDRYRELWSILSKEKYAAWVAVNNLVSSIHSDFAHNQLFYFDPSRGRIEPIVSDMLGHGTQLFPLYKYRIWQDFVPFPRVTLNERMQPLMSVVLSDPTFYDLRNRLLYRALTSFGSRQQQIADLTEIYEKIDADVNADQYKTALQNTFIGGYPIPYSNAQFHNMKEVLFDWIGKRETFLLSELEKSRVSIHAEQESSAGDVTVLIEVSGHSAVDFDPERINGKVYADRDLDGSNRHAISQRIRLYPGLREYIGTDWDLWTYGDKRHLVPSHQRYLFKVQQTSLKQLGKDLGEAFRNATTKSQVAPTIKVSSSIDTKNYVVSEASLHAWRLHREPETPVELGPGIIDLLADLNIGREQTLTIMPGTRVRLAKDVSIFSRGKVLINGTSKQPVVFERLHQDDAWGGLAIQGKGASGSTIKFAVFSGGTKITHPSIRYSGMVSVYNVDRIVIENSKFSRNVISDDTLHVVNSDIIISDARFSKCYGDCIDYDYSRAEMINISIDQAGNDGIDFMGSVATLNRLRIAGAGDKGLSVGEKSELRLSSASIERASTGIAIKDASKVHIDSTELNRNDIAVDVYVKHKIYGGPGSLVISNTRLSKNEVNIRSERGGNIVFQGQDIPERVSGDGKIEVIN